jgi:hypothetical protein
MEGLIFSFLNQTGPNKSLTLSYLVLKPSIYMHQFVLKSIFFNKSIDVLIVY